MTEPIASLVITFAGLPITWKRDGDRLKWAVLSPDGRYRYALGRRWDVSKPTFDIVMLNPSTADHELDDPTIRRCIGFAKALGCGGLLVRNLFALRSPFPRELLRVADPFGPFNMGALTARLPETWGAAPRVHVVAWGRVSKLLLANAYVECAIAILKRSPDRLPWQCFGTNKDGSPKHPLYMRTDAPLQPWP